MNVSAKEAGVQPRLSIGFHCPGRPEWCGAVCYSTPGRMNRALRNILEAVPAHVLKGLAVTVRGTGRPMEVSVQRLRAMAKEDWRGYVL